MTLPRETIRTGAAKKCPDCQTVLKLKVCQSAAGYYIGTECSNCGPYSRESGYYKTREAAERDLTENTYGRG